MTRDPASLFGRGMAFPPGVGPDGRMAYSEGPENVAQSIRLILLTEQGERIMRPDFGAGLGRFLFQPNTAATHRLIEEKIRTALGRWEPRIALENVEVLPDPSEPRRAIATIRYRLVSTGAADRLEMTVPVAASGVPA